MCARGSEFRLGDRQVTVEGLDDEHPTGAERGAAHLAPGEDFVCDPTALGTLYLSPFTRAAFEEAAGKTNASTVRAEANGSFLV